MTCTTVTGRGLGSVDKKNKGSEHTRMGVANLIGPRCVAVGQVTLSGGTAVVNLPVLPGTAAGYVVLANDTTANHSVQTALAIGANGTTVTFTGTASDVIAYGVFNTGIAISVGVGLNNTLTL